MLNATTLGEHDYLFPIFEAGDLPHNTAAVMFNIYSEQYRVTSIDHSIDCIVNNPQDDCTSITDIIHLVQDPIFRPAGLITLAFKLNESDTDVRGVVYTAINWDTVLSTDRVDSNYASDVDAVLSTGEDEYTFHYQDGQAIFRGTGDQHDSEYSNRRHTTTFTQLGSTTFSVSFYPTKGWVDKHRNSAGPLAVILITIGVMFLMSTVLYDHLINRENEENDLVMDTKRQFVRYISHEIRTPLNVVHLGLKVLYTEMVKLLAKCNSSDESMNQYRVSESVVQIMNDWLGKSFFW